jgi:hypothetical protein
MSTYEDGAIEATLGWKDRSTYEDGDVQFHKGAT